MYAYIDMYIYIIHGVGKLRAGRKDSHHHRTAGAGTYIYINTYIYIMYIHNMYIYIYIYSFIFRLYMALGNYAQAAKTAIIIARQEQVNIHI